MDSMQRLVLRTLALALAAGTIIGCQPKTAQTTNPAPLTVCEPKLSHVPAVFDKPTADGLAAPTLDHALLAEAECIDATATRHLKEVATRREQFEIAMADYSVKRGAFARNRDKRDDARAHNAALEQGWMDLARARGRLTEILDGVYSTRVPRSQRGIDASPLVAVALFDYARLVREHSGQHMHTRVAALQDNKFCEGDVIADRLLWRYFEAAVRSRGQDRDATAESVLALRGLALQSACLGERQLFELDQAMSFAAYELDGRLERAGLKSVQSAIAPFLFQVRLIVFDATKHLGIDAPAFRWWLDQEDLRRRFREGAVWPLEEVIWFYDRRTAVMAAIKTACRDGGSGAQCLNLAVLGETLTRPQAFGLAECSILEMVEGGIRNVQGAPSYTCTGGLCGSGNAEGRIPNTRLASTFETAWRGGSYTLPHGQRETAFGVPIPQARAALCGKESGAGFGGRDGAAGLGGPGMGAAGALLACVVGERASRTASLVPGMACIARFVAATSPLKSPSEIMTATAYAGIPRGCAIGDPAGANNGMNPAPGSSEAKEKEIKDAAKKLADEIKNDPKKMEELKKAIKDATGKEPTQAQIDAAIKKLSNIDVNTGAKLMTDKDGNVVNAETGGDGNITVSMLAWMTHDADTNKNTLLHEFVHALMSGVDDGRHRTWDMIERTRDKDDREDLEKSWRKEYEAYDQGIMKKWGLKTGGNKRCVAEDATCSNACNGMNKQTQQALACLSDALNPPTIEPRLEDLVTDPIEPANARGAQLTQCFDNGPDIGGVVAARQCGAVRCANAALGANGNGCCAAGGQLETSGFGSRQRDICLVARCEASMGASAAGSGMGDASMCGCSGSYASPPGGAPPFPPTEGKFPPVGPLPH